MIRTEMEYQESRRLRDLQKASLTQQETQLKQRGLQPIEIKRTLDPLRSFHLGMVEEIEQYESLRRGDLGELKNLLGLGRMLIGFRIALGLTQRELAKRLEVDESQVSRDERNEYHGVTVERASRILDAMQVELKSIGILPFRKRPQPRRAKTRAASPRRKKVAGKRH